MFSIYSDPFDSFAVHALNAPENKPPVSVARAAQYPENACIHDRTTGPDLDFWWLIVIGLNIPTLLTGVMLLINTFGNIVALVLCGPLVVTPLWNIKIVLARRRDPAAKVRWRKLLVACNIYIGLCGILFLVGRPGRLSGLPVTMTVSALAGIRLARPMSKKDP